MPCAAGTAPPPPTPPPRTSRIGRDFTATDVNTKYADDITHLPLSSGTYRYLATLIDLASRRLRRSPRPARDLELCWCIRGPADGPVGRAYTQGQEA
ncbi:hypothetical protein ACFVT1_33850 [Streptomyces sp. NPDC057963]|uniref:hypothetical protein n=1 Tax=Streptomyces sp. NPDC057963 TaxID=3346290 RepID=UPI0036E99751